MSTNLIILLRIIHILAGVAWVGTLFVLVFFIEPTSRTIGPAAMPFMQEMIGRRRMTTVVISLGSVTVAAGLLLYWNLTDTMGASALLDTGLGKSLTFGALAAIVGLLIGIFGTAPNVRRLAALGQQATEAGGPPSPELAAEIGATQKRLRRYARTVLVLLTLAIIAMAAARYT